MEEINCTCSTIYFLLDASIAENIALGENIRNRFEKLKLVANQAKIDEFIEKYPKKYKTFVGERELDLVEDKDKE